MRYKATSLAVAILLLATPARSQNLSPIVVETPRTTVPTTVLTGQLIIQTYIVKYIDSSDLGEEVIVQEEGLNPGMLGNFEVLKLGVTKTVVQKEFLEHWWYLNYTLRIINDKKDPYVIPPLTIPWVLKKIGQNDSDPSLKVNTDLKTDEVHINYVTTIPVKESNLDIRDEIKFDSLGSIAKVLRVTSWFFGVVPILVFTLVLVRKWKLSKDVPVKEMSTDDTEANNIAISTLEVVSRRKALRNLRQSIKSFYHLERNIIQEEDLLEALANLSGSLNDFLRSELDLHVGATPLAILSHIEEKIKSGYRKESLAKLANIAVFYQECIERRNTHLGVSVSRLSINTQNLDNTLRSMSWYRRFLTIFRRR